MERAVQKLVDKKGSSKIDSEKVSRTVLFEYCVGIKNKLSMAYMLSLKVMILP
jgi:hypothetical protein